VGQRELRWIKPNLGDDRGIACGGTFGVAVDDGESLRLAALYPVERAIDECKARRGVEIVCGSRHTCRRKGRVRGQGAQGLPRFIDRMRLDGPRLDAGRRVGAHRAIGACPSRRRRAESADRADRVGRVWGRGLASSSQGLIARFRLGERSNDCAALFKPGLPRQDFGHPACEGIPLEQQPACSFIEPRARFGQTVLIIRLHFRLSGEDCAHQVIVEGDIKGDRSCPGE
jgi:hypothetical protein